MSADAEVEVALREVMAALHAGTGWRYRDGQVVSQYGDVVARDVAPENGRALATAPEALRTASVLLTLAEEREAQLRLDLEDMRERLRDVGLDAELGPRPQHGCVRGRPGARTLRSV